MESPQHLFWKINEKELVLVQQKQENKIMLYHISE